MTTDKQSEIYTMPTGDIRNNLRKLQAELKAVRFESDIDPKLLACGQVEGLLHIYHHVFVDYSRPVAEAIVNMNVELSGKQDDRFMEAIYRILRDLFSYKPPVTKDQFFSPGFGEQKIIMCTDVLQLVRQKHKELAPRSASTTTRLPRKLSAAKQTVSCQKETNSPPPAIQVVKEFPSSISSHRTPGLPTSTSTAPVPQLSRPTQVTSNTHATYKTASLPSHTQPEGVPHQLMSALSDIQQALGRLELRMGKLEDRVGQVEVTIASQMKVSNGDKEVNSTCRSTGNS